MAIHIELCRGLGEPVAIHRELHRGVGEPVAIHIEFHESSQWDFSAAVPVRVEPGLPCNLGLDSRNGIHL